jgi:hypothetical protein
LLPVYPCLANPLIRPRAQEDSKRAHPDEPTSEQKGGTHSDAAIPHH